MKDSLSSGFALSALIHAALITTASLLIAGPGRRHQLQNIEVSLTDIPKMERTAGPALNQTRPKKSRRSRHPG
jgi:hypothetical protein